jgi:predicted nuclease of predicted toxin-antitoxin system
MKFLIDNMLPPALAEHFRARGLHCEHAVDVGLGAAGDDVLVVACLKRESGRDQQ